MRSVDRVLAVAPTFALVALVACGAGRHDARAIADAATPSNVARICLVRPAETAAHVTLVVRDNDRVVAATRGRTFACWLVAPGTHQISSEADDTVPVFVSARGGARYFVRQHVSDLGGYVHARVEPVDEETGRELIDGCDARVMVAVPGEDGAPALVPVVPARL